MPTPHTHPTTGRRRGGPLALSTVLDEIGLSYRKADHWIRSGLIGDVSAPGSGGTRDLTAGQAQALRFLAFTLDRARLVHDYRLTALPAALAAQLRPGEVLVVDLVSLAGTDPFAVARPRGETGNVFDTGDDRPRSAAWLVWDPEDPT